MNIGVHTFVTLKVWVCTRKSPFNQYFPITSLVKFSDFDFILWTTEWSESMG